MTCLPELTYALYADGELPPEERRGVESHLVGCLRCRERVVALREEADLLTSILHEVAPAEAVDAAEAPELPDARALALGGAPAILLGTLILFGLGWALETALPRWDVASGLGLKGVFDVLFRVVFTLRNEAPAAFEFALAIAAMASASALLTFALTAIMRRWSGPGPMALMILVGLTLPAADGRAHFGVHEHERFSLAAGEVHDGTLIAAAPDVDVDGDVTGDLFVFTQRLTIRGEVHGNVIAIAGHFELRGRVRGSVYVAGDRIGFAGEVTGDTYALGENFVLDPSGSVGRDVILGVDSGDIEGRIGRDLLGGGGRIEVRGSVARNVQIRASDVSLLDGAEIGGDVDATLPGRREVERSPAAEVGGEVRTHVQTYEGGPSFAQFMEAEFYIWMALHVAAGFLLGMLLRTLAPGLLAARFDSPTGFLRGMGLGAIAIVATPLAIVACAITLVGIPLAAMGLALFASALYLSLIVASALVGASLVHPGEGHGSFGLALLAGLVVVVLLTHTPFLAWPARIVAVLTGMGVLVVRGLEAWRGRRAIA